MRFRSGRCRTHWPMQPLSSRSPVAAFSLASTWLLHPELDLRSLDEETSARRSTLPVHHGSAALKVVDSAHDSHPRLHDHSSLAGSLIGAAIMYPTYTSSTHKVDLKAQIEHTIPTPSSRSQHAGCKSIRRGSYSRPILLGPM